METDDDNLTEVAESADSELIELVAYLDGELDPNAEDQMERRLVREASLRKRADLLDKTWNLLDSLEEVSASGQFTQRTLASVSTPDVSTTAACPDGSPPASGLSVLQLLSPARMAVSFTFAFLIATAAFQFGQWSSQQSRSSDDIELLQKMDLLEHYFSYRPIPNVQFLRDLQLQSGDADADADDEVTP